MGSGLGILNSFVLKTPVNIHLFYSFSSRRFKMNNKQSKWTCIVIFTRNGIKTNGFRTPRSPAPNAYTCFCSTLYSRSYAKSRFALILPVL